MSQFSNRRDPDAADSGVVPAPQRAYIDALLNLLGDADPLGVLREAPLWLRSRIVGLEASRLLAPEAPGKWSVGGVIAHLADSEVVWGFRLRMILAEERPRLAGYDQDLWAEAFDYAHPKLEPSLDLFAGLRQSHLELLARLPASDWERVAVHAERGEESVRHMVRLYAGHDLVHQRQIERILASQAD